MSHMVKSLVSGLRKIYENNWLDFCDFSISCEDDEIVLAPKLILAIHSEYFAALFRYEPTKSTLNLPQFNSDLVKLVIGSLILIDEKQLRDVELDQVIRIADYFQMTDLVEVLSDLMLADIKKENLQEMIYLIQDIHVPYLHEHCMDFIRANILDIFDYEPTIFQTLTMDMWIEIFKEPLTLIFDKFGRPCDTLETTENLYYVLIETLKASKRLEELPDFIEKCLNKDYLYTIFKPVQIGNDIRILPRRLKIENDVKDIVLKMCPKRENLKVSTASLMLVGSYGTHDDIVLTPDNHESWQIEGLIRKINVKSRYDWDDRHIVQGIQVFLENGESQAFGMDLDDTANVSTLEVPADQHIRILRIKSGFYIDSIGFDTNRGWPMGPIGGPGGTSKFFRMREILYDTNSSAYVSEIRGKTVVTQGLPAICEIEVKYVLPGPRDHVKDNERERSELSESPVSFDGDLF